MRVRLCGEGGLYRREFALSARSPGCGELRGQRGDGFEMLGSGPPIKGEANAFGVKKQALVTGFVTEIAIFGEIAVGGIADDGEVAFLALHAQLVAAAGVGLEFQQAEDGGAGEGLEVANFAGGGVAGAGGLGAQSAVSALDFEVVLPEFPAGAGHAKDECSVVLFDFAMGEAFADEAGEGGVGGDEDDTGGGGIEAVDEVDLSAAGQFKAFLLGVVGGVEQGAVGFRGRIRIGVGEQARGFLQGDEAGGVVTEHHDAGAERK
jgi:hypothetical protein